MREFLKEFWAAIHWTDLILFGLCGYLALDAYSKASDMAPWLLLALAYVGSVIKQMTINLQERHISFLWSEINKLWSVSFGLPTSTSMRQRDKPETEPKGPIPAEGGNSTECREREKNQ